MVRLAVVDRPKNGSQLNGRAEALFHALQDRHIPITPKLAADLAAMAEIKFPAEAPRWGAGFDRAAEAIGMPGKLGRSGYWSDLFDEFVRVVAEPVLRLAARSLGEVLLFSSRSAPSGTVAPQYQTYADRLELAVDGVLRGDWREPTGIWTYAGVSLLTAYRKRVERRRHTGSRTNPYPNRPDPATTRLLFEIEPDFGDELDRIKKTLRTRIRSRRERSGIRPREGGVTGVDQSRRLEDLGDALPSTFLLPPQLLTVKLLEEGFSLTHRPPHRHPSRDLLVVCFNRAQLGAGPASLIKAAWADATLRLRGILAELSYERCELCWCDITDYGPSVFATTVEGTRRSPSLDPMDIEGDHRRRLFCQWGHFPRLVASFPETSRTIRNTDGSVWARERAGRRAVEHAVRGVIATRSGGPAFERPERARVSFDDYAAVLAIGVPPIRVTELSAPTWSIDRETFRTNFALTGLPRLHLAGIYPPAAATGDFQFASDREKEHTALQVDPDATPSDAIARLIGRMSIWFIIETLEALHGG